MVPWDPWKGSPASRPRRAADRRPGADRGLGLGDAALPDRLRDRRGHRHRDRHGRRVLQRLHDRVVDRARLPVRLCADEPAAASRRVGAGAVIPIALASDTLSILTMEIVDNLIMVAIPGALHAGLGTSLFWGSLSFALAIAFVFAVPVNRWLIARGKGHAAVHATGIHRGPPPRSSGRSPPRRSFRLGGPDRGSDLVSRRARGRARPPAGCR